MYALCYLGIALVVAGFYLPRAFGNPYTDVSEDEFGALVAHAVNTSSPLFVGGTLDGPPGSIRVRGGWATPLQVWRVVGLFALTSGIVASLLRLTQVRVSFYLPLAFLCESFC